MARIINGLDVDRWLSIIDSDRDDPGKARVTLRASTRWNGRARSCTEISTSCGKSFEVHGDEPRSLLGECLAPKAVEYLLHALGACLAVGLAYNASARSIVLHQVKIDLEGDIDLRGFLGISSEIRPGYQKIRIRCQIKADASREEVDDLWAYAQRTSPVLDVVSRGVPVSLSLSQE